ncbi:MAG: hypothetical protein AB7O43_22160, partial [Hyphomicrobiaceae bacterium]
MSSDPTNTEATADNLDVIRELLRKLEEVAAADASATNRDSGDDWSRTAGESAVLSAVADVASDTDAPSALKPDEPVEVEAETIAPIGAQATRPSLREQLAAAGDIKPVHEKGLTTLQRGSALAQLDVPSFPEIKLQSHDLAMRPDTFHQLEVAAGEERRGPARIVAFVSFMLGAATAVSLIAFMDPIKHAVRAAVDHARVMTVDANVRSSAAQGTIPGHADKADTIAEASDGGADPPAGKAASTTIAAAVASASAVNSVAAAGSAAPSVSGSGDGAASVKAPLNDEGSPSESATAGVDRDDRRSQRAASAVSPIGSLPGDSGGIAKVGPETSSSPAATVSPHPDRPGSAAAAVPAGETPKPKETKADVAKTDVEAKPANPVASVHDTGKTAKAGSPADATPAKAVANKAPAVRVAPQAAVKDKPATSSPVMQARPNTRPSAVAQGAAIASANAQPAVQPGSQPVAAEAVPPPSSNITRGKGRLAKAEQRLTMPAHLTVSAGRRSALGLQLNPMPKESDQLLIILRGVPETLSLSKGSALGNEIWLLPAHEAHDIIVNAAGPLDKPAAVEVQLVSLGGEIVARSHVSIEAGEKTPGAFGATRIATPPAMATSRLL